MQLKKSTGGFAFASVARFELGTARRTAAGVYYNNDPSITEILILLYNNNIEKKIIKIKDLFRSSPGT